MDEVAGVYVRRSSSSGSRKSSGRLEDENGSEFGSGGTFPRVMHPARMASRSLDGDIIFGEFRASANASSSRKLSREAAVFLT